MMSRRPGSTGMRGLQISLLFLLATSIGVFGESVERTWVSVQVDDAQREMAASLVKEMTDKHIFPGAAIVKNIISVAKSTDTSIPRYFYTMDIDQAGVTSVVLVEAYQEGQIWKAILPLPTKNMKNGSPETFTSPTDVWQNADVKSSLVKEASTNADLLLQSTEFTASVDGRPELVDVIHAEIRTRNLGVEIQYLTKLQQSLAANAPENAALLLAKRESLVTTLTAKADAIRQLGMDSPAVQTLSCDATSLQKEIALLEESDKVLAGIAGVGKVQLIAESLSLLNIEQDTQQEMSVSGSAVPNSYTYVLMILKYQTTQNFITSHFRKQVVMYKDASGGWKLVSSVDFIL